MLSQSHNGRRLILVIEVINNKLLQQSFQSHSCWEISQVQIANPPLLCAADVEVQ